MQAGPSAAVPSRLELLEENARRMSTKLGQAATVPVATFASAPTGKAAVPVIAVTLPEHPGKAVDAPGLVGQQAGEELNGEV